MQLSGCRPKVMTGPSSRIISLSRRWPHTFTHLMLSLHPRASLHGVGRLVKCLVIELPSTIFAWKFLTCMILSCWIISCGVWNFLCLSELWSKLQRPLRRMPAFQSMLVWHSSLCNIKLLPMIVLFLSINIRSNLDLFQWTWVTKGFFLISGLHVPWYWSM